MKLKEWLKKVWHSRWVNKYSITFFVFVVFIIFFDNNSLIKRYITYLRKREVNKEIKYYQEEISANQALLDALDADTETLERYAREQYKMKQKNEDVYIIKEQ